MDGTATEAHYIATEIKAFQAQQVIIPQSLDAVTKIFEVGGAFATSESRQLDRHWRNIRTAGSHNPLIHREAAIGAFLLNGSPPGNGWHKERKEKQAAAELAASASPVEATSAPVVEPSVA